MSSDFFQSGKRQHKFDTLRNAGGSGHRSKLSASCSRSAASLVVRASFERLEQTFTTEPSPSSERNTRWSAFFSPLATDQQHLAVCQQLSLSSAIDRPSPNAHIATKAKPAFGFRLEASSSSSRPHPGLHSAIVHLSHTSSLRSDSPAPQQSACRRGSSHPPTTKSSRRICRNLFVARYSSRCNTL